MKHSIHISFQRDLETEEESKSVEKDDVLNSIDTFVAKLNSLNKQIIVDYNYTILSDDEFDIFILFKHLFSKFDEKQRYIYLKCYIIREKQKILFHSIDTGHLPVSIGRNVYQMNIKNGSITYELSGNNEEKVDVAIKYTNVYEEKSKNVMMIENFITSTFLNSFDEIKKSIIVKNGKLSI
jgi:hypothetical protein